MYEVRTRRDDLLVLFVRGVGYSQAPIDILTPFYASGKSCRFPWAGKDWTVKDALSPQTPASGVLGRLSLSQETCDSRLL